MAVAKHRLAHGANSAVRTTVRWSAVLPLFLIGMALMVVARISLLSHVHPAPPVLANVGGVSAVGHNNSLPTPAPWRLSLKIPKFNHHDGDAAVPKVIHKHSVVEPDDLARNRTRFLELRMQGTGRVPVAHNKYRIEQIDDAQHNQIDSQQEFELKLKFGNPAERAAAKEKLRPKDIGEIEFEEALASVPFADRMRLRRSDTTDLDPAERKNILEELDAALASFAYAAAEAPPNTTIDPRNVDPPYDHRYTLCTFVPSNAFDASHLNELQWATQVWGDKDTIVFTDNATLYEGDDWEYTAGKVSRAYADLNLWRAGHRRRILHRYLLRSRGSSKRQLKGRGELSLPLFYLMWHTRDTTFKHCDFFMKADTDAFFNKRALHKQLDTLDASHALYVGLPLRFSSVGFNYTQMERTIDFNVGGPGYIFSRGLLNRVDMVKCFKDMAMDPIWLIHDDVGTGYCVDKYGPPDLKFVRTDGVVAASTDELLRLLLEANPPPHDCYTCAKSIHPLPPNEVERLGRMNRRLVLRNITTPPCHREACGVQLIHGWEPFIGSSWSVPGELTDAMRKWPKNAFGKMPRTRDEHEA